MNRCNNLHTAPLAVVLRRGLMAALLMAAASTHAWSQEAIRTFPAASKRGTLQVTYPPNVMLNGQAAQLSPGARIRGTNNMLVLSGTLVGQSVPVNYVLDAQGQVHDVWVLNATEAAQSQDAASLPPNYVSDPSIATDDIGSKSSAPRSKDPK